MLGGIKPQYDCIKAFSETDFSNDLREIDIPVLILHGDADEIMPIDDSARKSAKLLKKGTLKAGFQRPLTECAPRSRTRSTVSCSRSSRIEPRRGRSRRPCATRHPRECIVRWRLQFLRHRG